MQRLQNTLLAAVGVLCLLTLLVVGTSRSGHSAGGAVAVQVTNAPLSTTDADNPARTPFSKRLDITFSNGSGSGTFTVPAGQRLVITYVSCDVGVKPAANTLVDLATYNGGAEVESHLPTTNQGVIFGQQVYACSCPMTVYADAGSTVTVALLDSDNTSGGAIVGVYGYLITP